MKNGLKLSKNNLKTLKIKTNMGIKALKEQFNIGHIVQIEDGKICIGSPYIPKLIWIEKDYSVKHNDTFSGNKDLVRYFEELTKASKSGELKRLIESQDEYSELQTIWTADDGRVIKKQCEVFEWPNVTTDGQLIYENTFFETRKEALRDCRTESFSRLKGILMYRCRDLIHSIIKTSKYTLSAIGNVIRAYLFFGY